VKTHDTAKPRKGLPRRSNEPESASRHDWQIDALSILAGLAVGAGLACLALLIVINAGRVPERVDAGGPYEGITWAR